MLTLDLLKNGSLILRDDSDVADVMVATQFWCRRTRRIHTTGVERTSDGILTRSAENYRKSKFYAAVSF